MKLAVVGSRTFDDYDLLRSVLSHYKISKVVSGGARGADRLAEAYAKEFGIGTVIFPANWELYIMGEENKC